MGQDDGSALTRIGWQAMNTAVERRGPDRRLGRFLVVPGILATIGLLVIYPVFFLVTESLNTG